MRIIISVTGKNHPGIIAGVTTSLSELNIDIIDLSQTIVDGFFTMILIANLATSKATLSDVNKEMEQVGQKQKVLIQVQSEEIFDAMHSL